VADFDETVSGLRAWAEGDWIATAATELLISHETWIVGQVKNLIDEAKGLLQREGTGHG
jgi:hypothetical protein